MIAPFETSLNKLWTYPPELPYPADYKPSESVKEVVGGTYTGPSRFLTPARTVTYRCIGYDPRVGFWMQEIGLEQNFTCISERAIGRTFLRQG